MTVLTALTLLLLLIGSLFYKETRKEFISHLSWVADDRFKQVVKQEGETMVKVKLW